MHQVSPLNKNIRATNINFSNIKINGSKVKDDVKKSYDFSQAQ